MEKKQLGALGEKIALKYLEKKGYRILEKNYLPKFLSGPQRGEVDIIAKKGDIISFIEVKTLISKMPKNSRSDVFQGDIFLPEEKVDFSKQRKVTKIAENWLAEKKIPLDSKWQIDIVAIKINPDFKKAKIRHLQNIC